MRTHLLPGHEAGKVGECAILVRARNERNSAVCKLMVPFCALKRCARTYVCTYVRTFVRTYVRAYESTYVRISKPSFRYHIFLLYYRAYARNVRTFVLAKQERRTTMRTGTQTHTQIS